MKKNNSNIFPLLTGLLVGGAAVYFLKSKKGKEIIDIALEKSETVKRTIVDNSKDIIESSQKAIDKAIESSKDSLSVLADGAKEMASNRFDEIEDGINRAKSKIANSSN